jgi:hypothetical protein
MHLAFERTTGTHSLVDETLFVDEVLDQCALSKVHCRVGDTR